MRQLYSSGERAQVDPSQLFSIQKELREAAQEHELGDLQKASGELKTGYLSDVYHEMPEAQEPLHTVKELIHLSKATGASEEKLEELAEIEFQYAHQLAEQGQAVARAALCMGLLSGALDAVIVSTLDGTSGSADPSLKPEVSDSRAKKFVQTLYNEPDKARQRYEHLEKVEGAGTLDRISYHVGSADAMTDRMMSSTQPGLFKKASLRLFADAYHIGMNLVYKESPELKPQEPESAGPDLEISEDGFLIGDVPLDINWG